MLTLFQFFFFLEGSHLAVLRGCYWFMFWGAGEPESAAYKANTSHCEITVILSVCISPLLAKVRPVYVSRTE